MYGWGQFEHPSLIIRSIGILPKICYVVLSTYRMRIFKKCDPKKTLTAATRVVLCVLAKYQTKIIYQLFTEEMAKHGVSYHI